MPAADSASRTRTHEWLSGAGRLGSGSEPNFRWLLLALLLLIGSQTLALAPREFSLLYSLILVTVAAATMPLLPPSRAIRTLQLALCLLGVTFLWVHPDAEASIPYAIGQLGILVFFVSVAMWTAWHLMRAERATAETLIGAVCGYLLVGIAASLLFSAVEAITPGAVRLGLPADADAALRTRTILYFSFVTLTTIGYGDIVPVSPAARMLAVTTGVVGQFYIAGVVARLVSLLVAPPRSGSTAS